MLTEKALGRHTLFCMLTLKFLERHALFLCTYNKGSGQAYMTIHYFCVHKTNTLTLAWLRLSCVLITKALDRHVFFSCANSKDPRQAYIIFVCLQQ